MLDLEESVLTIETFNTIKRQIIDLELRPGEILMVQTLAQQLGASRTPVREALIRLVGEGLVEHAEGRKFKVSEITLDSIREIYDIREAIECFAIAAVARTICPEALGSLRSLMEAMSKSLDAKEYDTFMSLDRRFHGEILSIYGNRSMSRIAEQMNDRMQRIRYLTINIEGRLEHTVKEHLRVIEFLETKNPEGASLALKEHIKEARADLEKLFLEKGAKAFGLSMISRI